MVGRVGHSIGNHRSAGVAIGVGNANGHDFAAPGDGRDPDSVAARRGGIAGDAGAVPGHIRRVRIPIVKVPARNQLRTQIGMRGVDAGIQYRDDDAAAADRGVPRCRRSNLGEVPFKRIVGVVRNRARLVQVILLGKFYVGVVLKRSQHCVRSGWSDRNDTHVDLLDHALLLSAMGAKEGLQLPLGNVWLCFHQQSAFHLERPCALHIKRGATHKGRDQQPDGVGKSTGKTGNLETACTHRFHAPCFRSTRVRLATACHARCRTGSQGLCHAGVAAILLLYFFED